MDLGRLIPASEHDLVGRPGYKLAAAHVSLCHEKQVAVMTWPPLRRMPSGQYRLWNRRQGSLSTWRAGEVVVGAVHHLRSLGQQGPGEP